MIMPKLQYATVFFYLVRFLLINIQNRRSCKNQSVRVSLCLSVYHKVRVFQNSVDTSYLFPIPILIVAILLLNVSFPSKKERPFGILVKSKVVSTSQISSPNPFPPVETKGTLIIFTKHSFTARK